MNILVTGGAGFVGSACLRHLVEIGHTAIAFDNLAQGHAEAVPQGCLIQGDILDTRHLEDSLRGCRAEAVMHFAAATCVGESVDNPEYHYRNNIAGTLSLLTAMKSVGVRRLLFSSTCATYGDNPRSPMNEDAAQIPCSPYARTKLTVEWMISDFAAAYELGYTILRYFNAAGGSPDGSFGEDHHPENHLIPLVLQVALGQRDKIKVFGDDYPTEDGTCIRDYIHVDDLAKAHSLAIEATNPQTREVYNVGTGHGHSVMEVIRACEAVVGRSIPCEITARRPGDPPALVADPDKLKRILGWSPKYEGIEKTVASAWRWHSRHPDGYRSNARP
ncbi:MAG: UDP-glucose 4-epimerase GalE [Pirellulales bacterium]